MATTGELAFYGENAGEMMSEGMKLVTVRRGEKYDNYKAGDEVTLNFSDEAVSNTGRVIGHFEVKLGEANPALLWLDGFDGEDPEDIRLNAQWGLDTYYSDIQQDDEVHIMIVMTEENWQFLQGDEDHAGIDELLTIRDQDEFVAQALYYPVFRASLANWALQTGEIDIPEDLDFEDTEAVAVFMTQCYEFALVRCGLQEPEV